MPLEMAFLAYEHVPMLAVVLARLSGFFALVPFFSTGAAPLTQRAGLTIGCALLVYPLLALDGIPVDPSGLAWLTTKELLIGLALGGLVRLLFAGLQLAGHLAGFGIGLSLARAMDPNAATEDALGPALYQFFGIVLFIVVGGHREVLLALFDTYYILPVGSGALSGDAVLQLEAVVVQMFHAGVRLAAPVAAVLFLIDLLLSLANRIVPQVPVLMLGMPVKAWVGIACLGWALTSFSGPGLAWLSRAPELITGMSRVLARTP